MTALAAPPHQVVDEEPAAPRVRVRRAPQFEPPYDDERAPAAAIPGTAMLPFAWPARGPRPQRPVTPRQPRGPVHPLVVHGHDISADDTGAHDTRSHPTRASIAEPSSATGGTGGRGSGPAPAVAAAERFLNVCLEVLNGHRPASHLRAVTAAAQVAEVTDQLVRRTARTYLATTGRTGPVPRRVRLMRLHTCEPRDGVAEVVAVLAYGSTTWAMAARLERHADVWLCTLVHVI